MLWSRLIDTLRMMPAILWVMAQAAMAAPVVPTAEAMEKARLVSAIGVADIRLCSPVADRGLDGGPAVADERCPWCQAFDEAVLPGAPGCAQPARAAAAPDHSLTPWRAHGSADHAAYQSRAPPLPPS